MATEKRLIWGDIAENQLMKLADYYRGSFSGDAYERAAKAIAELPAVDSVEVVRCKDCKHYKPQRKSAHWHGRTPYCCRGTTVKVSPDDFCSYGERRPDGN